MNAHTKAAMAVIVLLLCAEHAGAHETVRTYSSPSSAQAKQHSAQCSQSNYAPVRSPARHPAYAYYDSTHHSVEQAQENLGRAVINLRYAQSIYGSSIPLHKRYGETEAEFKYRLRRTQHYVSAMLKPYENEVDRQSNNLKEAHLTNALNTYGSGCPADVKILRWTY